MGERRQAREFALQVMYSIESSGMSAIEALRLFWGLNECNASAETKSFTEDLVCGTADKLSEIDAVIGNHSTNWKISRMSAVDRNIMRMAIYELHFCPDIPARVTLNEAIEIAKQYGTEESSAFVNGILDRVAKELNKE